MLTVLLLTRTFNDHRSGLIVFRLKTDNIIFYKLKLYIIENVTLAKAGEGGN